MSSLHLVRVNTRMSSQQFGEITRPLAQDSNASIARLARFFHGMAGGVNEGLTELLYGAVCASGSIVFTDQPSNNETLRVGNVTFTAKTAGAGANEWNIVSGGTAAADANGNAVLVAALINGHATLSQYLLATVSAGTVTVAVLFPGLFGNGLTLEEGSGGMSNCTVTGFAGGTDGTRTTLTAGSIS